MYSLVEPGTPDPARSDAHGALRQLLLSQFPAGLFALDAAGVIVPPLSPSVAALFRRQDCTGLVLTELLRPLVPRKFVGLAAQYLAALQAAAAGTGGAAAGENPLRDLEVRFANGDGTHDLRHYAFEFTPMQVPGEPGTLLVRVTDRTLELLQARELEDLRLQVAVQADLLQTVLRAGTARLATVIRTTDTMLESINEILRRPAREDAAFRTKLDQTLSAADRIVRVLAGTSLTALTDAAHRFESMLLELRDRPTLSGNDFLPLAVRLDDLSVQFSQVRSLAPTLEAQGGADAEASRMPSVATSGVTASPAFVAQLLERPATPGSDATGLQPTAAGTLAHTFRRVAEQVSAEHSRPVTLHCEGLEAVPAEYLATVKNIVIQFIRNAVLHGIEPRAERARTGKPPLGRLRLNFRTLPDGSFELTFEDDGRGIDPESVREIAITRSLITPGVAISLPDRQALKMIFKAKFTTLEQVPGKPRHGTGLAFVRRYVHDAGGVISLGSEPGRSTRFRVSLPPATVTSQAVQS
jgi:signal transduction histidine kinase